MTIHRITVPTSECVKYCQDNRVSLYKTVDNEFFISYPTIREAMLHEEEVAMIAVNASTDISSFELHVTCDSVMRVSASAVRVL